MLKCHLGCYWSKGRDLALCRERFLFWRGHTVFIDSWTMVFFKVFVASVNSF